MINYGQGNARPEKGQARPAPTPCPLATTTTTTTTTTKPPCPLATTTTPPPCPLATTEAPLSPCEKYRLEQEEKHRQAQEKLRSNAYVMGIRNDQPYAEQGFVDQPMADQPMLMAVEQEDEYSAPVTPPALR